MAVGDPVAPPRRTLPELVGGTRAERLMSDRRDDSKTMLWLAIGLAVFAFGGWKLLGAFLTPGLPPPGPFG